MEKQGMRKFFGALALAVLTAALLLTGCTAEQEPSGKGGTSAASLATNDKPQVIATLFPQFDFARQIAGDKADVTLLLPPGVESHSYEPTPSDMTKIHKADVFLYTGENMEAWSHKLVLSLEDSGSECLIVDVSKGVPLARTEDIEKEHDHEAEEADHHDEVHSHIYDPHIWTDPQLAKIMVSNILEGLCSADPDNAEFYKANASAYMKQLDALDLEIKSVVDNAKRREIVFGSRFAFYYFAKRYDLDYESAFDSCSAETEPSARRVASLIDEIKEKKLPAVFYAELEEPKTAKAMSAETGAKLLMLHSCHNVTKDEWEDGATYLSLMKQNAENLKEGLNE